MLGSKHFITVNCAIPLQCLESEFLGQMSVYKNNKIQVLYNSRYLRFDGFMKVLEKIKTTIACTSITTHKVNGNFILNTFTALTSRKRLLGRHLSSARNFVVHSTSPVGEQ